ncbi:MAG: MFS transporter, partial [Bacteroidota bacterium]|nr:MFS transporter [Bacteroidota bacterium]
MEETLEKPVSRAGASTTLTTTIYPILLMISFSHMLNDTIQSLIPAIYP